MIEGRLASYPAEPRALERCMGQTLRQDVYPERDNPPFDRVCMDGIAIDSEAFAAGLRRFKVLGTQSAGVPPLAIENRESAIEVMTGAVLPGGTDCIIPMEQYEQTDDVVVVRPEARSGRYHNVQRRGADSPLGVPMLKAGMRLGAAEVAVIASAGLARVLVSTQPRFMVISTGDELIEPGLPIAEHQVRRSNAYAVVAALQGHGFENVHSDHIGDDEGSLSDRLQQHLTQHDVLILSGGVSKGKFDLVPKVLRALGVEEVFRQVAQQPGRPMWFGIGPDNQAVFGLAGNPVSTLVCLIRYVVPAVASAMGRRAAPQEHISLAAPASIGRAVSYFLPIQIQQDQTGRSAALPRRPNGPGDFLALTGTDGFLELPPNLETFPEGYVASLYRW